MGHKEKMKNTKRCLYALYLLIWRVFSTSHALTDIPRFAPPYFGTHKKDMELLLKFSHDFHC